MGEKLKVLNWSPLHKLTLFTSALTLVSGCSWKNSVSPVIHAEAANSEENVQKVSNEGKTSSKPNVVFIVLDDSGFSDLGSYGSEIQTPNMDWLAENGLRYNNSHVTPLCSPTRASLLTGRNSHAAGMGLVTNYDLGPEYPNKRGQLKPEAGTIAEVLGEQGYNNYALGKWHLAPAAQTTPAGPYDHWPLGKGFDRFYGFLEDSGDQYRPDLVQDNSPVEVPEKENYHFSEDIVDKANQYITDQASINPEKPFFLYLSFGAQHMPHQVPEKYIDMYKGVYDKGWDQIRQERFNKQKDLGIIPENTVLPPSNAGVKPWDELSEEEKKAFIRFQETYAGFLTHTDEQVGRFLDQLRAVGELEDTMIVLLSDNGASSMGKTTGSINHTLAYNLLPENFEDIAKHIDEFGSESAGTDYPAGWAQVSNTPFKSYKKTTYSGGTHTPLIVYYPNEIKDNGSVRNQFVNVSDIVPTVYDVSGIELPNEIKGVEQMPLHGKSFRETFTNENAPGRETQYFEVSGQRAIYHDGWRAIAKHKKGEPYEKDTWELYNLKEDFSETNNLADQNQEKVKELEALWQQEAEKYGVLPMDETSVEGFLYAHEGSPRAKNSFTYYQGMSRLTDSATPLIMNRSYSIKIPIERKSVKDDGVLVASGGFESGYTLYIKNNQLFYEYNMGTEVYRIQTNKNVKVPVGKSTIRFEFDNTGLNKGKGTLFINDQNVGEGLIEQTHQFKIAFEGLDIGKDTLYPVSENYKKNGIFEFTGKIEKVVYNLEEKQ